jgi:hypothetical protein
LYYNLQKLSGENGIIFISTIFQLHKSYENAIGTRNVQLWHYKGKQKNLANRIYETNCLEIEKVRVQENAA